MTSASETNMDSIKNNSSIDGSGDKIDIPDDDIHILRRPERLTRSQICRLFSARKIQFDGLSLHQLDSIRLLELYNQYLLPYPQRSYCQRHREGRRLHAKRIQFYSKRTKEDLKQDTYLASILQEDKWQRGDHLKTPCSFVGSKRRNDGGDVKDSSSSNIQSSSESKRPRISWP